MRAAFGLGVLLLAAGAAFGQSGVKVVVDEVIDNRVSSTATSAFQVVGSLEVRVKLDGSGLDKASAARVIVKEAKDDKGNVLTGKTSVPDFTPREYNNGTLQLAVKQPARDASSVRVKGAVELYVPTRDPGASFKVEKALAKLDAPMTAKQLKSAKLALTPLSPQGYVAALQARKLDTKSLDAARAEAKAQGATDAEIEMMIELAKAFDNMDESSLPPGAVVLSGKKADFDRIYSIDILGEDGEPINISSRGLSSRGESSLMTLQPSQPPPENPALRFQMITDKTRVTVPFDVKVELP